MRSGKSINASRMDSETHPQILFFRLTRTSVSGFSHSGHTPPFTQELEGYSSLHKHADRPCSSAYSFLLQHTCEYLRILRVSASISTADTTERSSCVSPILDSAVKPTPFLGFRPELPLIGMGCPGSSSGRFRIIVEARPHPKSGTKCTSFHIGLTKQHSHGKSWGQGQMGLRPLPPSPMEC